MSNTAKSVFPKMGDEPLVGSIVNISGQRSPYTMMQPRDAGGATADVLATGTNGHRGQIMMSGEHPGPTFRPMTTISYPNAPEARNTGRGMRILRPSIGNRDFWDTRALQSGQVIK